MSDTIGVFGDSIMKGVVYDSGKSKYTYLENSFVNDFIKKTGIAVDNFAKFGCTLTKGEKIIEKCSEKLSQYKYIALEFGGNDCDFFWPAVSDNPHEKHMPNTPIESFEIVYSRILDSMVAKQYRPVLFSLPPLDPQRYFAWISKGLDSKNILRWLGDVEFIYHWQEKYSLAVVKLAATKNIPLIDIRKAFLKCGNYKDLLCEDGIHPNKAGHSLIFKTITEYI
ncbi:MAG: SGNH/GDSL hydrolase family protein [Anaerovoracaceae bacterium]